MNEKKKQGLQGVYLVLQLLILPDHFFGHFLFGFRELFAQFLIGKG